MLEADVAGCGQARRRENPVPTVQQCRTYAANYKTLGKDQRISARRSSVLLSISRSWMALAHQFESLAMVVKDEDDASHFERGARRADEQRAS
jgi:hypothetical protein